MIVNERMVDAAAKALHKMHCTCPPDGRHVAGDFRSVATIALTAALQTGPLCPSCGGAGRLSRNASTKGWRACERCNGTGHHPQARLRPDGTWEIAEVGGYIDKSGRIDSISIERPKDRRKGHEDFPLTVVELHTLTPQEGES